MSSLLEAMDLCQEAYDGRDEQLKGALADQQKIDEAKRSFAAAAEVVVAFCKEEKGSMEAEAPAIQITPDDGAAIVKGKEMLATLEGYTSGAARDKRAAQLAPAQEQWDFLMNASEMDNKCALGTRLGRGTAPTRPAPQLPTALTSRSSLPLQGLERVSSILLDKMSNYDIDVFMDIFKAIQALCPGLRDYQGKVGKEEDPENIDMAYRVVADHIRTLTFAITDGAMPSNEGRGYVLRRILRRAVRYGGEILKAPEGFFHQLVDVVVEVMADGFPELRKNPAAVKEVLKEEEATFSRTLKKGVAELEKRCKKLDAGGALGGADAFTMFDTYGFPLDLTVLMCEEKGFTVRRAIRRSC